MRYKSFSRLQNMKYEPQTSSPVSSLSKNLSLADSKPPLYSKCIHSSEILKVKQDFRKPKPTCGRFIDISFANSLCLTCYQIGDLIGWNCLRKTALIYICTNFG
ncbi:hypothetical protein CDAR_401211 [Caerostris darwini]|uniref:Uncharacterized protein n=1 Tax=Caerostris darwini TaxID=1538125 RepID=A0AAV4V2W1_9ARAC|nr:hypothetical protein CDAR_401211 [Caerostris darwini]